jgi:hypothetical protein
VLVVGGLVLVAMGLGRGSPLETLLAHPVSEAPGHLWMQWLLERALTEGGGLVGIENIVLHEPLWVLPTDLMTRLLSLPLSLLLGRTFAHNASLMGLLALGVISLGALARRLGAPPVAAAAGALLFLWSPALLGFAADGRIDSLGVCWLPVLGLAWLRVVQEPSVRTGLLLGLAGAAVALAGINHAVVAAVVLALPTVVVGLRDRRRIGPLALGALLSGLAAGALLGLLVQIEGNDPARLLQTSNPDQRRAFIRVSTAMIHEGRMADFWWGAQRLHQAEGGFSWWSLPPTLLKIGHTHHAADMLTVQSFAPGGFWTLGITPWVLVGLGVVRHPRQTLPLAGLAVLTQLLGLGLGFPHTLPFTLGSTTFYLAPAVLWEGLPGISRFNNYGLFSVVSAMCQGLVAARVLAGLPRVPVAAGLVLGLWLVEVQTGPAPLPLETTDLRVEDGLRDTLGRVSKGRGVLVLPLSRDTSFFLQTVHERPSPHRFRAGEATPPRDPMLSDPDGAIHQLLIVAQGQRQGTADLPQQLARAGLGAVVLVPDLLPPKVGERVEANLFSFLGPPRWSGAQGQVWLLP